MELKKFIFHQLKSEGHIPEFPEDQSLVVGNTEEVISTIIAICEIVSEKQKLYCSEVGLLTKFNITHCESVTNVRTF